MHSSSGSAKGKEIKNNILAEINDKFDNILINFLYSIGPNEIETSVKREDSVYSDIDKKELELNLNALVLSPVLTPHP